MKIKLPWLPIDGRHPEDGKEVIWMDVDGSYHLARRKGNKVLPAVYGNADTVERNIEDHVCYMPIMAPEVE